MSNIHSPHSRWAMAKFRKGKSIARRGSTSLRSDKNFSKSSAQVETPVSPQVVSRGSCELKLGSTRKKVSPKRQKRRNPLTVRLSDQERDIITTKAALLGVTMNSYMRAAALDSDYKPPRDPELLNLLRRALRELTAQGNNLNQIAKQLNSAMTAPERGLNMLETIRRPLISALNAVRDVLIPRGLMP